MSDLLPTVRVPLRWADIDSLNHVNNVAYLDYAFAAQDQLIAEGELNPGLVSTVGVDFHQPLLLEAGVVDVSNEVRESGLVQRIYSGDTTVAGVTSGYVAPEVPEVTGRCRHRITPRYGDLAGADNDHRVGSSVISTLKVFEYMQEARIGYVSGLIESWVAGGFVVANVNMSCHRPVRHKHTPYDLHAWIERVGTSSVTVQAQIVDGPAVLASADSVLVGFDLQTQASRPFAPGERTVLLDAAARPN